jgi:hypothetical protein
LILLFPLSIAPVAGWRLKKAFTENKYFGRNGEFSARIPAPQGFKQTE